MTYTETNIKEALDLAKHQNPHMDWGTITDRLFIALNLVSKLDGPPTSYVQRISSFTKSDIREVYTAMRKRRPL